MGSIELTDLVADGEVVIRSGANPDGAPAVLTNLLASRTRREAFDLATDATGGVAGIYVQNQGDGRYGIAINSGGSTFNAFYINYSHADDADYGIGIDVGANAIGGLLIDCDGTATAIRVSGTSTTLVEWKNGAGTSKGRINTSSNLVEFASNMGMRWYSDGYSSTVAEVKVDGTDAGLANFFNRGIRTKHYGAATPTLTDMPYGGEIATGDGKIWVNAGGAIKSVAIA